MRAGCPSSAPPSSTRPTRRCAPGATAFYLLRLHGLDLMRDAGGALAVPERAGGGAGAARAAGLARTAGDEDEVGLWTGPGAVGGGPLHCPVGAARPGARPPTTPRPGRRGPGAGPAPLSPSVPEAAEGGDEERATCPGGLLQIHDPLKPRGHLVSGPARAAGGGRRPASCGARGLSGSVEEGGALEGQPPLAWVILPGPVGVEAQRPVAVGPLQRGPVDVHAAGKPEDVEQRGPGATGCTFPQLGQTSAAPTSDWQFQQRTARLPRP